MDHLHFYKKRKFNRQPQIKKPYHYRNLDARYLIGPEDLEIWQHSPLAIHFPAEVLLNAGGCEKKAAAAGR